jgi:glycosyltransferase involved in cell wall biosynthesis
MTHTARGARGAGEGASVRVLHVINRLSGRAGAEVSLRDIVVASAGGHVVHGVVVLRGDGNVTEAFEKAGVPVFVPKRTALGRLAAVRHIRVAIGEFRPDLLHTSLFEADLAGRVAAAWTKRPVLSSLVSTPYGREARLIDPAPPWKQRSVLAVDRVLAQRATTAFHAISQTAADHAVEHLGISRERIRVVPRGRSRAALGESSLARRSAVRDSLGWGADRPVVLNVARQEPPKGHVLLAEAMAEVLRHRPDALLGLVGREGRSTAELEKQIRRLGIGESVARLGVRTDVGDLLAAADVFAFSSLHEGLGGAVVEAAALGVPVVAFGLPALREVLGDDHPWLVETGDTRALGRAIVEVLRGGPAVEEVGRSERHRFDERYELDVCVRGMTQLYRDVAAGASGRDRGRWRRVPEVALR